MAQLIHVASSRRSSDEKLLYGDHSEFNEAIEILIKIIDRLDRFDRVFAQE